MSEVIDIHRSHIERYGGTMGIRDMRLLESALALPQATFDECFLHEDLFAMAAAYLFHIVQNHPFLDGNKRTGAASADVFLNVNGIELVADADEFAAFVREVACGNVGKAEIAEFLRAHSEAMKEEHDNQT